MDHVAIMKKSWNLLPKLVSGEKKIESRWYSTRHLPWGRIKNGDRVFFKNSGELVTVEAMVEKVVEFENLDRNKINELLVVYGKDDGIEQKDIVTYFELFKDKKYCVLIFVKEVKMVKPFGINKSGYGAMSAWITVPNINLIRQ